MEQEWAASGVETLPGPATKRVSSVFVIVVAGIIYLGSIGFDLTTVIAAHEIATLAPGAFVSDLYQRWAGTRGLLLNGIDPYGQAATDTYERGFYGRLRQPNELPFDSPAGQRFYYPLYSVWLFAPLSLLPFPLAQVIATIGLGLLLGWSVWSWCRLTGWPKRPHDRALVVLVATTTYPAIDLLSLQQPTGFLLALLVGAIVAIRGKQLVLGGALLALAMIKPQAMPMVLLAVTLWVIVRWPERRGLAVGFLTTMALLLASSWVMEPSWFGSFVNQLREYAAKNETLSPLTLFVISPIARLLVGAVVLVVTGWIQIAAIRRSPDSVERAVALGLAATLVVFPTSSLYTLCLLSLPAVSLGRSALDSHWARVWAKSSCTVLGLVILISAFLFLNYRVPTGLVGVPLFDLLGVGYMMLPVLVWLGLLRDRQVAR